MSENSNDNPTESKVPTPKIYKCCDNPQITYLSPVNINVDEKTIGSVDDAQSGLTPGSEYYVQSNGTLATGAGNPSVKAGLAISATNLLIRN